MKCTPMFKLLYIERYMIPHVDSMFLGQLLIVTILEQLLLLNLLS